jgi:ribosomal protein L7/L12
VSKDSLPEAAVKSLWEGRKVDAVRHLREAEHLGLKDAHDRVKKYISENPALEQKFASSGGGVLLKWLVIGALMSGVAYAILTLE